MLVFVITTHSKFVNSLNPGDVRNDMFITIVAGKFDRGNIFDILNCYMCSGVSYSGKNYVTLSQYSLRKR